jgi:hypothetical protein
MNLTAQIKKNLILRIKDSKYLDDQEMINEYLNLMKNPISM